MLGTKSYYDSKLLEYTQSTGGREHLRKDLFVDMVSSVWLTGLSPDNVVAGFRATGIHPVDRSKYNTSRLDKLKLKTYSDWVEAGKPADDKNQPILPPGRVELQEEEDITTTAPETAVATPQPATKRPTTPQAASLPAATPTPGCSSWQPTGSDSSSKENMTVSTEVLKKFTDAQLVNEQFLRHHPSVKSPVPTSLEAVLHARGRSATPATKRRKVIPMVSQVITDEECRKKIAEMAQAKKKTKKNVVQRQTNKKETSNKRKLTEEDEDLNSTTVSSVEMNDINTSSDFSLEDFLQDERQEETEDDTVDSRPLCSIDDADVHKYVAVYYSDPKPQYYWGKLTKVFSTDEDTDVTEVEVDFLQKKTISSDPSAWTWVEKKVKEVLVIDVKFIVFGPVVPEIKKNVFTFPDVQATASLQKLERFTV